MSDGTNPDPLSHLIIEAPPGDPSEPKARPAQWPVDPHSNEAAFEASKVALPWVDGPEYAITIRSKERAAFIKGYNAASEVARELLAPTAVPDLISKIAEYQAEVTRLWDENARVMAQNADHCETIQAYIARYRVQNAKIKDLEAEVERLSKGKVDAPISEAE